MHCEVRITAMLRSAALFAPSKDNLVTEIVSSPGAYDMMRKRSNASPLCHPAGQSQCLLGLCRPAWSAHTRSTRVGCRPGSYCTGHGWHGCGACLARQPTVPPHLSRTLHLHSIRAMSSSLAIYIERQSAHLSETSCCHHSCKGDCKVLLVE